MMLRNLSSGLPTSSQLAPTNLLALVLQVIAHYAQRVVSLNADKPQDNVAKQIDKALSA